MTGKTQRTVLPAETREATVPVSGPLPPSVKDWPEPMQEKIAEALTKLRCASFADTGLLRDYSIVQVSCHHDEAGYYVKIMAQAPPLWVGTQAAN